MMKKKKIDLKSLKVKSFVTETGKQRFAGGLHGPTDNGLGCSDYDDCG